MSYNIFQNIQLPADRKLPKTHDGMKKTYNFSTLEKFVFYSFLAMILVLLAISGWSVVLLATGKTASGGPIGMAAKAFFTIAGL